MDEQHLELALSYGPEDAFVLHRYHRPPRSSSGTEGVRRPVLSTRDLESLSRLAGSSAAMARQQEPRHNR